jgi:hypothetical protein
MGANRECEDFPSAVRVFEGIKFKVENKGQYGKKPLGLHTAVEMGANRDDR